MTFQNVQNPTPEQAAADAAESNWATLTITFDTEGIITDFQLGERTLNYHEETADEQDEPAADDEEIAALSSQKPFVSAGAYWRSARRFRPPYQRKETPVLGDQDPVKKLTRARDTIISDIVRCADGFGGEGFTCPPFAIAELDSLARALDGVELALSRFDPHGHHAFRTGAAIAR